MVNALRERCRQLLDDVEIDVVIGYGRTATGGPAHAIFVTEPKDVDALVWDEGCLSNLTAYLTRPEVQALGRPAVVVKGCDARALVVLEQECQIDRRQMYAIGMACDGVGTPQAGKCAHCDAHTPKNVDCVIGEPTKSKDDRSRAYDALEPLMRMTSSERMAYWRSEFSRCVKCYACRAVCPTCYCTVCVVDKNRPVRIDTSAHATGNFAWHITRAFHQAGRCTGCGECTRACPAGIDLERLNATLRRSAENHFDYRAGTDASVPPVLGSYGAGDREDFIR